LGARRAHEGEVVSGPGREIGMDPIMRRIRRERAENEWIWAAVKSLVNHHAAAKFGTEQVGWVPGRGWLLVGVRWWNGTEYLKAQGKRVRRRGGRGEAQSGAADEAFGKHMQKETAKTLSRDRV